MDISLRSEIVLFPKLKKLDANYVDERHRTYTRYVKECDDM